MRRNKILYDLTAEDFQSVALEQIGRLLSDDDLARLADWVAERIPWYDLISEGLDEFFSDEIGEESDNDLIDGQKHSFCA